MKSCLLKKNLVYDPAPTHITKIRYDEGYVIETTQGSIYMLYETMSVSCPCAHGIILVHQNEYPAMHYKLHEYLFADGNNTPSDTVLKRLEGFEIKEVNYLHDEDNDWRLEFIGQGDKFDIIIGKSGCTNGHAFLWPKKHVFMYDGFPKQPQLDRVSKIFHDHTESRGMDRDYWDNLYLENNAGLRID